jgi:glycine/D-amino acid oxidase-like deaminating enzyme
MKNYATYSYWLETCGDDLTPRPALDGSIDVDVAILGAGFTGLWTAYYLQERDPSLKIAILEREIAGFGASGRNGGGLGNRFPVGLRRMAQLFGRQAAIDLQTATVIERGKKGENKLDVPNAGQDAGLLSLTAFIDNARGRKTPPNNAESARISTLTAMLGRKSIYEKRVVQWQEIDV